MERHGIPYKNSENREEEEEEEENEEDSSLQKVRREM